MHIYIQVYYEGMRAAGYLSLSIYIYYSYPHQ